MNKHPHSEATLFSIDQQQLYATLVEENEVGLFALKNDLFYFANPSFLTILNTSSDQLLQTSIFDLLHPNAHPELEDILNKLKKGAIKSSSLELQQKCAAGTLCYLSFHLKYIPDHPNGLEIIGASRVATNRVIARKELKKAKSKYEIMFRNLTDGVFIYNYSTERILDCNDAALRILGYENKKEILKLNRFDFIPKDSIYGSNIDSLTISDEHKQRIINGEIHNFCRNLVKKDGSEILVDVHLIPTEYEEGETYVIFHDKTKEIQRKQELEASEERYRIIFEHAHEGIIYTDVKTQKRIICNKKYLELLGYDSFDEAKNVPIQDLFVDKIIDGIPVKKFIKLKMNEALKEKKSNFSIKAKRNDGSTFMLNGILVGDTTDKENPKVLTFIRDNSAIHNAQEKIKKKNEDLKKYIDSNMQLENFAYLASHDLQTPLRSIISFTQILQKRLGEKLSVEEKEYMEFIITSSKNMQHLISDLLLYSRVNTTKIKISEVNINNQLELLQLELAPTLAEKNATISIENIPNKIMADQTKIRQVIQNLLTNALKFTSKETSPKVQISCKELDQHWEFSVSDNGIGIEPQFQEKIFLLFKRLHPVGTFEGTGIGLSMVKKIIEQHEGKIWLKSIAGEGTTFYFTIPKR